MTGDHGEAALPNQGGALPPSVSAEQLAELAAARPDLWNEIWHHPNSYDGLRQWISDRSSEQHAAASLAHALAAMPPLEGQPPAVVQDPVVSQASAVSPKQRGPAAAVIAFVSIAALVLAGTGTALALTGTFDRWFGGSSSNNRAVPAAELERQASFADGVEVKWTLTGADLAPEAELWGHLPRMMGPINQAERADQPIQLESGVLVHYNPMATGGDVPASWTLLDNETGEQIWTEAGWGYPYSCATNPVLTQAVCTTSFTDGSKLIGLGERGIRFNVDSPYGSVHVEGDRLVLQSKETATSYSTSGEQEADTQIGGQSAGTVSNAEQPDCVWLRASETTHYLGSNCGSERVLTRADSFDWAIIESGSPKIIVAEPGTVTLFDAKDGQKLWSVEGALPGHLQDPQMVRRASGDALLLQREQGNTLGFSLIDIETGEELILPGASSHDRAPVIAGGQVLLFEGAPPVGDPITSVKVLSAETGEIVAEHSFEPVYEVAEIIGGPSGVLFGHPKCTNCSTAEGSHVIDRYTFLGPTDSRANSESVIRSVIETAPDFVPACPGETLLLAWMELDDGWIVVCGVDVDTPSYVAYQPGSEGTPRFSLGATAPTSERARSSVLWDADVSRYVAAMADGSKLTLDYKIGTATLRDGATRSLVNEQLRFVRYVFVPMGAGVRGIAESSDETGAFDVRAPKSTADDQIRYMIEVLEKAYQGRAMLKDALPKLAGCSAGPGGYSDTIAAMQAVRDNRAELLQALDAMPVDKIPEGKQLLADLTEAIELSHQANVEYVTWAEAAHANGCATLSATGKAAADASDAPKERFASRWNSAVAPKYGVRTFDAWFI